MAGKQILALLTLSALAAPVHAGEVDGSAVIGGAIGGATGAAVGSAIGGREGAIIGGAIGGAAGAAIATDGSKDEKVVTRQVVVEKEVVYVPAHHDNGRHRGHYKRKHGRDDD
jgi:outer membrane lipoprotein SlyB